MRWNDESVRDLRRWRYIVGEPIMAEMELVNTMGGGEGRGELRDRSIKFRTPLMRGSNPDKATLKSTRQATHIP